MSMSGIEVDPEIAALYQEMNLRKTHQYGVFQIQNKKKVVITAKGEKSSGEKSVDQMKKEFETFVEEYCKEDEPAYILFDFNFTKPDGGKLQKMKFIYWCPDTAKIGPKMLYASTKESVKQSFPNMGKAMEVSALNDLDFDSIVKDIK